MKEVFTGAVINTRMLTDEERQATRKELAWLEQDLVRRRHKLAYWTQRKSQIPEWPDIPDDLRRDTLHFYEQSLKLVLSGEKLRAFLIAELQDQPEHQPAYHYAH